MLSVFVLGSHGLKRHSPAADEPLPDDIVWFDLLEPTAEEEKRVEQRLKIDVPTREEMREIETSNRLYEEDGVLYMTATIVTRLDTQTPENNQVTFILAGNRLITNRYVDPLPFRRYVAYAERHASHCATAPAIFAGLLESIVNRIADVIERVGADLDAISADVFAPSPRVRGRRGRRHPIDYRPILERIGQSGDLISKARESLGSLNRLLAFVQQSAVQGGLAQDVRGRMRSVSRDVVQMSDHAAFLNNKVQFILDATLGLVNIEQNGIIKIFSVAAVVFLPPTLVASIYGMNFEHMPELSWPWGYPMAVGFMVLSAVLPYLWFKRKGWL